MVAHCSSPEKARRGERESGTHTELVETIHTLVSVLHLYVFIGGDISRRGPVRIDIAGSRGSHVGRFGPNAACGCEVERLIQSADQMVAFLVDAFAGYG